MALQKKSIYRTLSLSSVVFSVLLVAQNVSAQTAANCASEVSLLTEITQGYSMQLQEIKMSMNQDATLLNRAVNDATTRAHILPNLTQQLTALQASPPLIPLPPNLKVPIRPIDCPQWNARVSAIFAETRVQFQAVNADELSLLNQLSLPEGPQVVAPFIPGAPMSDPVQASIRQMVINDLETAGVSVGNELPLPANYPTPPTCPIEFKAP